jgi:3-phenylpropionate/trans-cinnamate dioxygenase ferredoxin subunit
MGDLVEVGITTNIEKDTMLEVSVKGREVLLTKVGDTYYAADSRCPHMGGRLSEGSLDGTIVTCPRHGSQFDLADGSVVRWLSGSGIISSIGRIIKSPKPIRVYKVKIEEDKVLIEV